MVHIKQWYLNYTLQASRYESREKYRDTLMNRAKTTQWVMGYPDSYNVDFVNLCLWGIGWV